jgi:hypothetical protein
VQKSLAVVEACEFRPSGRSSIVCFENASVEVEDSLIQDANCHAICARGDARVAVRRTRIDGAELRSIFCYHSSSLEVADCTITGTRTPPPSSNPMTGGETHCDRLLRPSSAGATGSAAIQIDALRPMDAGRLALSSTVFARNAGGDLAVSGNVEESVMDCELVRRTEPSVVPGPKRGWNE